MATAKPLTGRGELRVVGDVGYEDLVETCVCGNGLRQAMGLWRSRRSWEAKFDDLSLRSLRSGSDNCCIVFEVLVDGMK